ncbi:MAG: hypothetical protein ABSF87_06975 [Xanthobacteraceae bacterium]|jgi:hypothetical protein
MTAKQRPREVRPSAPIKNPARLTAIIDAISKLDRDDLEKYGAWSDLDALSTQTSFEGIEPHPDGIFKTNKKHFDAIATVYVTLNYGGKRDRTSMSDSYPARVTGSIIGKNNVTIDSMTIDTSSFYQ